jgi:thiol-disulfide isomerase/thioredoxin
VSSSSSSHQWYQPDDSARNVGDAESTASWTTYAVKEKQQPGRSSEAKSVIIPGSTATLDANFLTSSSKPSSFKQRMLDQLRQRTPKHRQQHQRQRPASSSSPRPSTYSRSSSFIQDIHTLDEFSKLIEQTANPSSPLSKSAIGGGSNSNTSKSNKSMILLWYYAPWCTSCHALRPGMEALARRHTLSSSSLPLSVVQIACDESNVALHQGLSNIPSVPFVQLYVVDVDDGQSPSSSSSSKMQIVLEMKMNRKRLNVLHKSLLDLEEGSCSLERLGQWSVSCPYSFSYHDPAVSTTMSTDHKDEGVAKKRLRP